MRTDLLSRSHTGAEVRPTVWGYASVRTTSCLLGEVPGVRPRLESRTDVVVPGLTPRELARVQRHVVWRSTARPGRLVVTTGLVAAVAALAGSWAQTGRPLPLVALVVGIVVLATVHGLVRAVGPRLGRTERVALRHAVEIRRTRAVDASSIATPLLVAMSAVEGAAEMLDETGRALARELLRSALDAVRRRDHDSVRHTTTAMLRLAVRAAQSARPGVTEEPLA
jgi:hypothetical protein